MHKIFNPPSIIVPMVVQYKSNKELFWHLITMLVLVSARYRDFYADCKGVFREANNVGFFRTTTNPVLTEQHNTPNLNESCSYLKFCLYFGNPHYSDISLYLELHISNISMTNMSGSSSLVLPKILSINQILLPISQYWLIKLLFIFPIELVNISFSRTRCLCK